MYKLLIADDEKIECTTLERMISGRVAQVKLLPSVYDGVSLVRRIEESAPDIVIADINMPGMTGLEAIERMHERRREMQVIINTAYSDFEFARRALKCGAVDYVLKPCNKEAIVHAVEAACGRLDEMHALRSGLAERQLADIARILAEKMAGPQSAQAEPPPRGSVQEAVLGRIHVDTEKAERRNAHIRRAMDYLRSSYMQDISLDDVAGVCGISPFYMSRMFKQTLDINFVALLASVRMERAIHLLGQGIYSNSEIARAVGYASASYFHKVFRRYTGMTLGDYREAIGVARGEEEQP